MTLPNREVTIGYPPVQISYKYEISEEIQHSLGSGHSDNNYLLKPSSGDRQGLVIFSVNKSLM